MGFLLEEKFEKSRHNNDQTSGKDTWLILYKRKLIFFIGYLGRRVWLVGVVSIIKW